MSTVSLFSSIKRLYNPKYLSQDNKQLYTRVISDHDYSVHNVHNSATVSHVDFFFHLRYNTLQRGFIIFI